MTLRLVDAHGDLVRDDNDKDELLTVDNHQSGLIYAYARKKCGVLRPSDSRAHVAPLVCAAERRGFNYMAHVQPSDELRQNSCWLAASIQLLTVNRSMFQLAQHVSHVTRPEQYFKDKNMLFWYQLGHMVAVLVTACAAGETNNEDVMRVYDEVLEEFDTRGLLSESKMGSIQVRSFEALLVLVCACIDPAYAPLHRVLSHESLPPRMEDISPWDALLDRTIAAGCPDGRLPHAFSSLLVRTQGATYDPDDVRAYTRSGLCVHYAVVGGIFMPLCAEATASRGNHFVALVREGHRVYALDNRTGGEHDTWDTTKYLPVDAAVAPGGACVASTHTKFVLLEHVA